MRKPIMLAIVILPIVFGICGHMLAEEAKVPWNNDQINALFPAPLAGWSAGDVDVNKDVADFDSFLDAITGSGPARTTYTLSRRYRQGSGASLEMTINTLDPDMVGLITMAHDDPKAKASLPKQGITPTTVGGLNAVSIADKSGQLVLIKIGSAGTLGLECVDGNCIDAIDCYLECVDLQRIEDFVKSAQ